MTQAYPLAWPEGWPRTPPASQTAARNFRTTLDKARRHLLDELRKLGAKNVIVSTNIPLRNDGQPRGDVARMRIGDPGVAVYFEHRNKPMVIARDSFWNPHDNLHSIGLAIEHLRGLERQGGAHMMERAFAGFTALPPPGGGYDAPVMRTWREVLAPIPDGLDKEDLLVIVERRYRDKSRDAHRDATGGSDDSAQIELNAAIAQARKELA